VLGLPVKGLKISMRNEKSVLVASIQKRFWEIVKESGIHTAVA
jgi:hypothetical protein